jgi:hypothetical protein
MASLILGGAGAAIGSGIGGSFLGMSATSLGWTIGSTLGNLLFAEKQHIYGPRLKGDRFTGSALGQVRPIVYGTNRVQGKIIWQTPYHEHEHTEDSGGKGGGGTEYTTYTYTRSFAVMLCEGEIEAVRRIWVNGKLEYDWSENSSPSIDFVSGLKMKGIRIYPGSETQLPDPTIQSFEGVSNVSAYRGTAYIVFNEYDVTDLNGACPVIEAEVVSNASLATTQSLGLALFGTENWTSLGYINEGVAYLAEETSYPPGSVNPGYAVRINGIDLATGNNVFSFSVPNQIALPDLPGVSRGPCCDDAYFWYTMGAQYLPTGGRVDEVAVVGNAYKLVEGAAAGYGMLYLRNKDGGYIQIAQYGGWNDHGTLQKFMFKRGIYQTYLFGVSTTSNPDQKRWVQRWDMPNPVATEKYDFTDGTYNLCCYVDDTDVYVSNAGDSKIYRFDLNLNLIDSKAMPPGVTPVMIAVADGLLWIAQGLGGTSNISGTVTAYDYEDYTVVGTQSIFVNDSTSRGARSFSMIASGNSLVMTVDDYIFTIQVRRATRQGVLLSDIVANLHQRSGQTASDYEVGALTDTVRGYKIDEQVSARSCIEQLQIGFLFDAKDSEGKIKYVKRGAYPTEFLTDDDLGAFETEPVSEWTITRQQEEELPQTLSIVYQDFDGSYEKAAQNATRQAVQAGDVATFQVPVVFTADEAQSVAYKQQMAAWIGRTKYKWTTNLRWAKLEPCDVVAVKGETIRITSRTEGVNGIIEFEGVAELPEIYTSVGVGSLPSGYSESSVDVRGPAVFEVMDLPPLRDGDYNRYVLYMAASGVLPGWMSAAIMRSTDGNSYSLASLIIQASVMGYATTVLGDWDGGNVPDEESSVTVKLYGSGTLSSTDYDGMLSGELCFLLGNEIIFGRTATLVSAGVYTITGLLRGRFGTEYQQESHAVNDRFVLLRESSLRVFETPTSDVNAERFYKGVTSGNKISSALPKALTYQGKSQDPWTPVHIGGGTAGINASWTIKWMRRSRYFNDWIDGVGVGDDESSFDFEVRIFDDPDTPTTVKRTLTVSNATASGGFFTTTYTNAQQVTDFGQHQLRIAVSIRQIGSRGESEWTEPLILDSGVRMQSVFLCHCDGANGTTTFTDVYGKTLTANGNAQVSSTAKFGTGSYLGDGTGDYVAVSSSTDFATATADLTVEFFVRPASNASSFSRVLENVAFDSATKGWLIRFTNGTTKIAVQLSNLGGGGSVIESASNLSTADFTHVAFCRRSNVGYLFIGGGLQPTTLDLSAYSFASQSMRIGADLTGSNSFNGRIDEIRITNNYARYTVDFTPPAAPFTE